MQMSLPRRRSIVSAALITLAVASAGHAQVVRTWDGEDSTNFFDVGENWSGNVVPGSLDTARFTTPFTGTYAVLWDNFTGNRTTSALEVLAGNLTFRRDTGNPRTYSVTNAMVDAGRLQLNDITLAYGGTMAVNNGGRLDVNAAAKLVGNAGSTITVGSAGSGTVEIHEDGSAEIAGMTVAAGGQVNLSGGKLVATSITAGSGFHFTGGTLVTPNFTGSLVQDGGVLSPGDIGVRVGMIIASGYTMNGGTCAVDLVSSNTDQLIVGGPVSLAGALSVNNVSFPTTLGNTRILVDGTSVTGHFATISGVALTPNRYAAITYTASQALLTIAIPGDATLSNGVGFADLVLLAQNYNLSGRTWSTADFDGNGLTAFSDLVLLAQNYNTGALNGLPDGASADFAADWALAQSMVPEPVTMLALPAMLAMGRRRRPQ
jgi:hypothetical protein